MIMFNFVRWPWLIWCCFATVPLCRIELMFYFVRWFIDFWRSKFHFWLFVAIIWWQTKSAVSLLIENKIRRQVVYPINLACSYLVVTLVNIYFTIFKIKMTFRMRLLCQFTIKTLSNKQNRNHTVVPLNQIVRL